MPTDIKKILNEIQKFFAKNKNPENVKKYSKFFKEGYDAYGLDGKTIETKRAELIDKYKDTLGLDGFLELGSELLKSGKYEEASLAVTFPSFFKDQLNKKNLKTFKSWLDKGVQNWAHVDILCAEVIKVMLTAKIINYTDFSEWRYSKSKWTRRAVPVSLLHLIKEKVDHRELLVFITPLMQDDERVVQQGAGWFLREIWKIKPRPAESFLLKYKDTAPRLIIQYATEKMNREEKLKYKADKKKADKKKKK
jgi:3-methyladenine DNA glycosylase AlkD